MKKGILFLFVFTTLNSFAITHVEKHPTEVFGFGNRNNDAVSFFERGVRFHVFLNGDFDFDSRFYRSRRNRNLRIFRDFRGRISRVGNVRIRYDFRGNVRRIGRVTMNYNRGWLTRVGNLTVDYNRWGDPLFFGNVGFDDFYNDYYNGNSWNVNVGFNWNVGAVCVYNDPFFYGNEFRNSYRRVREDNNYIYYRANDGTNVSRDRILRRRKASSTASNGQTVRDRRGGTNVPNEVAPRRRSTQNQSTTNRRRSVGSNTTNNRKRTVQSSSNNNRKRSEVNTSQNRRKKVVRNESTTRRSSQINRTNKKKREVQKTSSSRSKSREVKRRRS